MILLKSIQLKNFLSHADTKIDFEVSERLLIDGKSGAGKSAIIDALIWGLYNVGRVQNRSLIKRGKKEAEVILQLTEGETTFEIVRKITDKGSHTLAVSQNTTPIPVSGTKNIQEFIEKQILKCSYSLFINSVCYPQENLESFVRQTPSKRKDILLELVHAEDYEVYYEKTKDLASEISGKLATFESGKIRLLSDLEEMKQNATLLENWELEVARINTETQRVAEQLEDVRKQEVEISALTERLASLKREEVEINKQLSEIGQATEEFKGKINALRSLDETQIRFKLDRLGAVKAEILALEGQVRELYAWKDEYMAFILTKPSDISYDTRINEIYRQLKSLEARIVSKEKCPHCSEEHLCTLIADEIKSQVSILNTELLGIGKLVEEHRQVVEKFQTDSNSLMARKPKADPERLATLQSEAKELEPYLNQVSILASRDENIKQFESEMGKLFAKGEELTNRVIPLSQKRENLETLLATSEVKTIKLTLMQQSQALQTSLWKATEQLTLAKSAVSRVAKIESEIQKQQTEGKEWQEKLDNLILLKEAFGTNGIKSIVIDYVLPQLENRINSVLQPLSDFRIKLDTQKTSVGGDGTIEGLFISVINDQGEEFDYDSYSGGQKIKILFAITEGLAQMQKIGFRILDEAVVGLDEESGDQFASAIMAFQERFQQLICISHLQQIKDLFEKKVNIINVDGNSTCG